MKFGLPSCLCDSWQCAPAGSCDNSSTCIHVEDSNFSYCWEFQLSSSALVDLASIDQLPISDSVKSNSVVFHDTEN